MEKLGLGVSLLQLHFITAVVLLFWGLWVSVWLCVGVPIKCVSDTSQSHQGLCSADAAVTPWNYSSTRGEWIAAEDGGEPAAGGGTYARHEWVGFVLFGQAVLFALPYWFWLQWNKKNAIQLYINSPLATLFKHVPLAVLFLCELFCWLNGISQSAKLDRYFGYAFTGHGSDVFSWSSTQAGLRDDPFIRAFPRRLKCKYTMFGASGALARYSAVCVLSISAMIEKIFMVSWFWFVFLNVVTTLVVVYHGSMWALSCVGLLRLEKDDIKKPKQEPPYNQQCNEERKPIAMNEMQYGGSLS